jgi:hypothetical protein
MASRASKEREAVETRQLGMIQRIRTQTTTQLVVLTPSLLTRQKRLLRLHLLLLLLPKTARSAQRHSGRAINVEQKRSGAP